VPFPNGSHFDGTIHLTVAQRRLHGSLVNVADGLLPSWRGAESLRVPSTGVVRQIKLRSVRVRESRNFLFDVL
jgi:hypothetical protein